MKYKHEIRLLKTDKLIAHADTQAQAAKLWKELKVKYEGQHPIWYTRPTRTHAR